MSDGLSDYFKEIQREQLRKQQNQSLLGKLWNFFKKMF